MKPLFFGVAFWLSLLATVPIAFALDKSGASLIHPYFLTGVLTIVLSSIGFASACLEA